MFVRETILGNKAFMRVSVADCSFFVNVLTTNLCLVVVSEISAVANCWCDCKSSRISIWLGIGANFVLFHKT